jgi:hypothetical protein
LESRFVKTIGAVFLRDNQGRSCCKRGTNDFKFGITSGCNYPNASIKPNIPWDEFVGASTAVYPQTYWRTKDRYGDPTNINGGTPDRAIDEGKRTWSLIAKDKPIIYMAGELELISPAEIAAYAARARTEGLTELHFYADTARIPFDNYNTISRCDE